jgi:hypothetical protein
MQQVMKNRLQHNSRCERKEQSYMTPQSPTSGPTLGIIAGTAWYSFAHNAKAGYSDTGYYLGRLGQFEYLE